MPGGMKAEAKIPADINEYFKSRGLYYNLLTDNEKEEYDFIGEVLAGGENYREEMLLPEGKQGYSGYSTYYAYFHDHNALSKFFSVNKNLYTAKIYHEVLINDGSGRRVDENVVKACVNEATPVLQKAIQIVSAAKGADHEKVKFFHDYIINNVTYDKHAQNCTNPRGALIEGKAKCYGYAETLNLLCNLADIPCYSVGGMTSVGCHAWNVVKLEDGEWYEVDCTFDQGLNDTHKLFLRTTAQMASEDYYRHQRDTYESYIPIANGTKFAYHGDIDDDNPYAPNGPEIKKITTKDRTMTLKWKKAQSGMNGYEIQYSTDKTFKKKAKKIEIKKIKKTSRVIKKLKRGKRYYVRIRSFNRKGMYYKYSKWSKVKSIKIK